MRYLNHFGLMQMTDANFNRWLDATLAAAKTSPDAPAPDPSEFGAKHLGDCPRITDATNADALEALIGTKLPQHLQYGLDSFFNFDSQPAPQKLMERKDVSK